MRLLRTDTGLLVEKNEYVDDFKYAILSHTWLRPSEGEEVLFADLTDMTKARQKAGWRKLEFAMAQAAKEGLQYVWVDTCCINKESSAELAEAINSMYRWYQKSEACYVYLDDYQDSSSMGDCRWFKRGWTLQEMIASPNISFHYGFGEYVGTLSDLVKEIAATTGVDKDLLSGRRPLASFSIAQKMSWAANRQTARVEDRAYSLLGIFDISLPVVYGEGSRAFQRLQEELIREYNDQTIFAWGFPGVTGRRCSNENYGDLLASSPDAFESEIYSKLITVNQSRAQKQCEVLGRTVRFHLPVSDMPKGVDLAKRSKVYAVLNCYLIDRPSKCITMELSSGGYGDFIRVTAGFRDIVDASKCCISWTFTVSRDSDNAVRYVENYFQQMGGPMLLIRSCASNRSIRIDSGEGNMVTTQPRSSSAPRVISSDVWDANDNLFKLSGYTAPLEQPLEGGLKLQFYLDGAVSIALDGVACIKVNIRMFPQRQGDNSFVFEKPSRFDMCYEALSGAPGIPFRLPLSSLRFYVLLVNRKLKVLIIEVNRHRPLLQNQDRFELIEFSFCSRQELLSLLSSSLTTPLMILYSLLVWPFWWFFPFFNRYRAWWRLFLIAGIIATTVSITTFILNDGTKRNKGTYGVVMAFIDGVLGLLLFLSLYPTIRVMLEKL